MKHKKMRGVVAMLLTLVMMVGMLPTSVYASDADGGGDQQRAEMHPHGDSGGAWQAKVCAFRLCRGRKKHLKA